MPETKKVYLPRQKVRPGFRHSYQGANVVIVDPASKKEVTAAEDAKAAKADKK